MAALASAVGPPNRNVQHIWLYCCQVSIHPFFFRLFNIVIAYAGCPRRPASQPRLPGPPEARWDTKWRSGSTSIGLLPVGRARCTSSGRRPVGIRTRRTTSAGSSRLGGAAPLHDSAASWLWLIPRPYAPLWCQPDSEGLTPNCTRRCLMSLIISVSNV